MAKNPHPREIIAILHEWFPACISLDARQARPLKVGIGRDISAAAPAISPIEIGVALNYYTNALPYLRASTEGAERIDLNGEPAGIVSSMRQHGRQFAGRPSLPSAMQSTGRMPARPSKLSRGCFLGHFLFTKKSVGH
jgi:ProP effector